MKQFNLQYNVGKVKYVINVHDGVSTHNDGSPFYGIETFKNKKLFTARTKELLADGYIESNTYIPYIKYNMFGNLDNLDISLRAWAIRYDEIDNQYRCKGYNIKYQHKYQYMRELCDDIEKHCARLVYVNVVEPIIKAYFYDNYFNLNDDTLKSYTALDWFDTDIIQSIYDTLSKINIPSIKTYWHELIGYQDDLFVELLYNTWKKVETDINSKTLKLELV